MEAFFFDILRNMPLWTAIAGWFIAQLIKFFVDIVKNKRISLYVLLLSTGGMPSSHSSFVTSLMVAVGFREGFHSAMFAVSAIVAMVTMADAAGIRRAAGKQAAVLNMLIEHLNNPHISLDKKLRELLGHSPVEVAAGACLGTFIAIAANQLI